MEAKSLGNFLKARGVISTTDWSTLERACEAKPTEIIKGITALGILSESRLTQILAEKTNAEILSGPLTAHLDPEILGLIDPVLLEKFEFIPLKLLESGRILIATANPLDRSLVRQLEFFTDRKISCAIATPTQIQTALEELVVDYEAKPSAFRAFISQFTPTRREGPSVRDRTINPSESRQDDMPIEDSHFDLGELDSLAGDEEVCFDNPDETMAAEDEITLDFGSFSDQAPDDAATECESEPSQALSTGAESPASEDEIAVELKAPGALSEETDDETAAELALATDMLASESDDVSGTQENPDTAELGAPAADEIETDEPSLENDEQDMQLDEIADDLKLDTDTSEEAAQPVDTSPVINDADELVTELESATASQLNSENSPKDDPIDARNDQDETAVQSADELLAELDQQLAPEEEPSQNEANNTDEDELPAELDQQFAPNAEPWQNDATIDTALETNVKQSENETASATDASQELTDTRHNEPSTAPLRESNEEETEASQSVTKPVGAERRLKRQVSGAEERGHNTAKIGKLNRALMNLQFTRESSEAARTCYEALSVVFSHGLIFRCVSSDEPEVFLIWNASGQQEEIDTDELIKVNAQAAKTTSGWNEQITIDTEGLAWPTDGEVFVYRADCEGIGPVIWISQAANPGLVTTAIAATCKQILHRFVDFIQEVRS